MPSLFNAVRTCIYVAVFVSTLICLAMAAHFQAVLAASDLTRFVPFALFVCSVTMLIITILLGFSFLLRERNPISTRIELACLGLMGVFWLVLGVYLATSESQTADVECTTSTSDTIAETSINATDDTGTIQTEQYQAMYRVLMSFSLINAILVISACLTLLTLAVRRHRKGDEHMWHGPVTSCAWFNDYEKSKQGKRGRGSSSSILPITGHRPSRGHSGRRRGHSISNRREHAPQHPYPVVERQQLRHGSGNSSSMGSNEFDNGGMVNPNRVRPSR